MTAVSKKSRSRQTRRYSPPPAKKTGPAPTTSSKRAAWRTVGGRKRRGGRSRGRGSLTPWALILGVVIAGGIGLIVASAGSTSTSSGGGTGAGATGPLLTAADSMATGNTVDGIKCDQLEQVAYHIHAHLAVFVNGSQRTIPEGIGITPPRQTQSGATGQFVTGGTCFYWLHAHTADGVIHIESPTKKLYSLGQYFDIWRQPLSSTQVGPATGTVTAYVNGKRFAGNPRNITLDNHTLIQLDVGQNVAPKGYTFQTGL